MNRLIIVCSILILSFSVSWANDENSAKISAFTLEKIDGKNFVFPEEKTETKYYVINFWATWCVPCMAEMKQLKTKHDFYNSKGVEFLSISIDKSNARTKVSSIVRKKKYPFTILLDPSKKVHDQFGVLNVPQVYIIDQEGNVLYEHSGYKKNDEKKLFNELDKLTAK